jgi:iron complex transport system substrate-binding protein
MKDMKQFFKLTLFIVTLTILYSCTSKNSSLEDYKISIYKPDYALGFEIVGAKDRQSTILKVRNPWQGAKNVETRLFISRDGENVPESFDGQELKANANRIVCMSSTHVAMLDAVNTTQRVVGVSGIDYISNKYVVSHKDSLGDVGFDGNINYELLVSLEPDLVLLFGVNGASTMEVKLKELGISFVYIGEYLEESPLGKAEWLVAISELIGKRTEGEKFFSAIPQRYNTLKEKVAAAASSKPKVMLNVPYGDSWFMPSTTSYVAQLISDAGGDYLYKKNTSNSSLPIDLEEAYLLTSQADLWLNVGVVSTLKELKSMYPKFTDIRCVENGAVYNSTKRVNTAGGNDFWESGVVNPDLILRDLIKIFHPELIPEDFYYYIKIE